MLPLDFHPLVEADLTDSAEWYARQEAGLDERFLEESRQQLDALPGTALLYAVRFGDIRRMNLPLFKHGIFYFVTDKAIVVLGILHGSRDSKAELQRRRKRYG